MVFAHFFCKQQKWLHLHRGFGLGSLETGGKTHPGAGLPQGVTIPSKQGDTAGPELRRSRAWGTLLLSRAGYCRQLNKLIGRIFPQRARRF